MAPLEPSYSATARPEHFNATEAQESDLKNNVMASPLALPGLQVCLEPQLWVSVAQDGVCESYQEEGLL